MGVSPNPRIETILIPHPLASHELPQNVIRRELICSWNSVMVAAKKDPGAVYKSLCKGRPPGEQGMVLKQTLSLLVMVLMLVMVPAVSAFGQEAASGGSDCTALREEIAVLEKTISELRDSNVMLMENLADCVEENQDLLSGLNASEGKEDPAEVSEKAKLIDTLGTVLKTEANLDFLTRLNGRDLHSLVSLLKERVP